MVTKTLLRHIDYLISEYERPDLLITNEYIRGMYNGLVLARSSITGESPIFWVEGPALGEEVPLPDFLGPKE